MKRILILGCCGAGKSTFSRKLSKVTNLELIHLDQHYWKPNWIESRKEDWEEKVKKLASKESWIIDGNYGSSLDIRLNKADTVIYLDASTIKCLYRITKRIIKYKGKVRPDMPQGCKERFDLDFYHYVATFNLVRRKPLLKKINTYLSEKNIFILKDQKQITDFFQRYTDKIDF